MDFLAFAKSEDGAVTVDWVVLTAALVAIGVAAGVTIEDGVSELDDNTGSYIENIEAGNV